MTRPLRNVAPGSCAAVSWTRGEKTSSTAPTTPITPSATPIQSRVTTPRTPQKAAATGSSRSAVGRRVAAGSSTSSARPYQRPPRSAARHTTNVTIATAEMYRESVRMYACHRATSGLIRRTAVPTRPARRPPSLAPSAATAAPATAATTIWKPTTPSSPAPISCQKATTAM